MNDLVERPVNSPSNSRHSVHVKHIETPPPRF
jgi:hypothetical protein